MDTALSAAGITVDVASSNASGLTFTFSAGDEVDQHNSLNFTAQIQLALLQALRGSHISRVLRANTVVFTENLGMRLKAIPSAYLHSKYDSQRR